MFAIWVQSPSWKKGGKRGEERKREKAVRRKEGRQEYKNTSQKWYHTSVIPIIS